MTDICASSSSSWAAPTMPAGVLGVASSTPAREAAPDASQEESGVQHRDAWTQRWTAEDESRLRAMVAEHFDFIWRSLRRLGIGTTDVDDCSQQVFWVAARKLALIQPGAERSFLFGTALRVASDARRSRGRRREVCEEEASPVEDPAPSPEQLAEQRCARARLDRILSELPMDLRAVFVLFELEEMSTQEIASMLELPTGTVASRLRRARAEFQSLVARMRAREAFAERGGA